MPNSTAFRTISNGAAVNITADTGSVLSTANARAEAVIRVSVVGTAGDCVTLPAGATPGQTVTVYNADSTDSMDVFPHASTGIINSGAAGAAFAVAATKSAIFTNVSSVYWIATLSA